MDEPLGELIEIGACIEQAVKHRELHLFIHAELGHGRGRQFEVTHVADLEAVYQLVRKQGESDFFSMFA